jgi:hypothetical protein
LTNICKYPELGIVTLKCRGGTLKAEPKILQGELIC